MTRISSLLCLALLIAACTPEQPDKPEASQNRNAVDVARAAGQQADRLPTETERMSTTTACYAVDTGRKVVLKAQTFAIDFEPFKNSCFVTSHDPEFKDPPLDAEIAIFKDGKKVEAFYHGEVVTIYEEGKDTGRSADRTSSESLGATCWVEAVSFQDVSADHLTDAILVAKCGAKEGAYSENRIYLNNGKLFVTRPDANARLSGLGTIKQIVDYTRQNPQLFSLIVDAANSNSQP